MQTWSAKNNDVDCRLISLETPRLICYLLHSFNGPPIFGNIESAGLSDASQGDCPWLPTRMHCIFKVMIVIMSGDRLCASLTKQKLHK